MTPSQIEAASAEDVRALLVELEAALERAATAEHRLFTWRRTRAARSKALSDFIKERAPELWDDYATLSVNGSLYGDECVIEPTHERNLHSLEHRAEKAEERATEAAARIAALEARVRELEWVLREYMSQFGQALEANGIPFGPCQEKAHLTATAALQEKNDG